ncbi:sulfate ABC transporter permease subunit, partial [Limnospira fusiformis KN01]
MNSKNIGYLHPKKLIQPAQNSQTQVSNFEVALVVAVILFVGLVLFIPAANIFVGAFKNGWSGFSRALTSPEFLHAAKLTVMIAAIVVPVNVIFGIVTAWAIARHQFPGRTLLLSIIDLPFSISPVVVGLMLVLLYGRQGWFGATLQSNDIRILFAFPGMVLATAFVCMPFVAREVLPALEEIGTEQEEAAKTMGANDWQTFWRVTLPSIRWS